MCLAARELTPPRCLQGLGGQWGHAGVLQWMETTAEGAEAVVGAHHLLPVLLWSSRGAGGPGAALQLGEMDPISVPAGGVVVCPRGLADFNPPSPPLARWLEVAAEPSGAV